MSEMLTDLMNNIYTRISQLGKSIQALQTSLETINKTLAEKTTNLVQSITAMKNSVDQEGEANKLIFQTIGDQTINEVKKLQERIGLKDLDELREKLNQIVESSQEALRPETVDVVLHEVLNMVKTIKGEGAKGSEEETTKQLDEIGSKFAKKPSEKGTPAKDSPKTQPASPEKPVTNSPASPEKPAANPPGTKPPGMKPPGGK